MLNYSVSPNYNFEQGFNTSETITLFPNNNVREDTDDLYEITRMVHIIIRPILITVGSIGNLLSFYIMRTGPMKKSSTCFYMSILALADTGNGPIKYLYLKKIVLNFCSYFGV